MDSFTKEILTVLKAQYIKVAGNKAFKSGRELLEYYTQNLDDNLYAPMTSDVYSSYINGSGNEIETGKMNAIRSSSALTYNLFWNQTAQFQKDGSDERIGGGVYGVEFEKQYHTLDTAASSRPANLDAFLYNEHTNEALACEMKMTEWLFNRPSKLRAAYFDPKNYMDKEAGEVFAAVAETMIRLPEYDDGTVKHSEYDGKYSKYDAFQMFKHASACYNACMFEEERKIKKLTLVNCIWTLPDADVLSRGNREKYILEELIECMEFEEFKKGMTPITELFATKGIDFDICFYTFSDFLKLLNKSDAELDYLKRYTFE